MQTSANVSITAGTTTPCADLRNGMIFDLHTHSNMSDGTLSPTELMLHAATHGIGVIALTDHDSVAGVTEASEVGKRLGLHVISGVELDTMHDEELHILGLGIDINNAPLRALLERQNAERRRRNDKILENLLRLGIDAAPYIEYDAPDGTLTRLHVANALVKLGAAASRADAFEKFLGETGAAYADFDRVSSEDAIKLIHGAGGVSVLAHPCKIKKNPHKTISELAEIGLWGLEAYYPKTTDGQLQLFLSLAGQYGMAVTCGSDFHGENRPSAVMGGSFAHQEPLQAGLDRLVKAIDGLN